MSTNTNPFTRKSYDLGTSAIGASTSDIHNTFKQAVHGSVSPICLVCSQPALYRLIPKHAHLNTAEVQDKGYACGHCCNMKFIDPANYSLREL